MQRIQHTYPRQRLRLAAALACAVAFGAPGFGAARLGPINVSGGGGTTLDVPIGFTSSEQIACLQFDLLYDAARVSLGAAHTGTAGLGHQVDSRLLATGRQRVVIYSTTLAPLNGGYIVQIPVTWTAAGDSALAVDTVKLANIDGTPVAFTSSSLAPAIASSAGGNGATGGSNLALNVEATTGTGVTYEWSYNGTVIAGATSATLAITSAQRFNAGNYQVKVIANGLTLNSQSFALNITAAAANNARLLNLSTRGLSLLNDQVLIPGFVINGSGTKKLLIRAVGPTLSHPPYNVSGTIADPRITLKRQQPGGSYVDVTSNDNWINAANSAMITSTAASLFAFPFEDDREAALLVDVTPGQYTVVADGVNNSTGVAILELYDADGATPTSSLINISNRGFVGVGDQVMIPGFVVSSEGPKTLLVRVVGPTLGAAPYNVTGTMVDPKLTVFRTNSATGVSTELFSQDNWSDNPDAAYTAQIAQQVFAFALNNGSKDAAFVVTLDPGVYTIVGSSATAGGTGVVLVEVYVVP